MKAAKKATAKNVISNSILSFLGIVCRCDGAALRCAGGGLKQLDRLGLVISRQSLGHCGRGDADGL
jgi:hypothetical protein